MARSTRVTKNAALQLPSMILTGAEIAFIAAAIGGASKSAADVGVKGTEALLAYVRKEGPMTHRILASWKEGLSYCIALEFINLTVHGGYVEDVDVTKPSKDFGYQVARAVRHDANRIGFDKDKENDGQEHGAKRPIRWEKRDTLFPLYVPPAGTAAVLIKLTDDVSKTLGSTSVITLAYQFSIVGGSDAKTTPNKKPKEADVRLRNKGPLYLD
jgi:hypothetical protein